MAELDENFQMYAVCTNVDREYTTSKSIEMKFHLDLSSERGMPMLH